MSPEQRYNLALMSLGCVTMLIVFFALLHYNKVKKK